MTRSSLVVDTNVISSIFKDNSLGPAYDARLRGHLSVISFQTRAELEEWTLNDGWGEKRKQALRAYLAAYTVMGYDEPLAQRWGWVRHIRQRGGKRIDPADAWIAATALALGCPLVTHNIHDFAGIPGLNLITENPA